MTRRGRALFAALSLVWGIPYLLIRVAVEALSPATLVCLRTALAAAVLLPVAVRGGQLRPALRRWPPVLAFAVVEIIVPFGSLSWAEERLPSALTGLLVASVPLIGAVLGVLLRLPDRLRPHRAADRRRMLGLAVGLVGVAAVVGIDLRGGDLLAAGAVLVAACGYALGPIVASTWLAGVPGLGVTVVAMAVTAVVYLPWALATPPGGSVGWRAWASAAALGLVCSALAFLIFFALVAEVGPGRTTVITYLNPVVAIVLGVLVLGERPTVGMAVGFPLVLLGSWWATRRNPPAEPGATS